MKKIFILISLLLVSFMVACGATTFEVINAETAKSMLDNDSSIILVDVRTVSEFNEGHIANAVLLPLDLIEDQASEIIPDKQATYIIYCRSGNRSNQASQLLIDIGYKNIYDMGGIIYWDYGIVS